VAIDRSRIALAGWSGGGSYIGLRVQAWPAWFSAIVIHGGGMAPQDEACGAPTLPGYFLVGNRNPLHRLVRELRAHLEQCQQEVLWDLVRDGDHDREDRALDLRKASEILDWLAARPRESARRK
jgi:predicted esterase